jgi:putative spermidine/putrescine transport system permease protein
VTRGWLARAGLRLWTAGVLLFLFVPIAIICFYAFNASNVQAWPIHGLSVKWFSVAWQDPQVRTALLLSVKAGLLATAVALALGSAAAFGVHRFSFFGREAVSLLLVLPLALPGIITGIALNSAFSFAGIRLSLFTIIIGHATFCIVVVYNNVLARLRRSSGSLYEAAADLGAHGLMVFRTITLPVLSTALVSGALLAFALSFDEVIVTTFTAGAQNTLPLWIFGAIRLGQQLPEVNVVVTFVLLLTLIPVSIAARLTGGGGITRASAGTGARYAGRGPGDGGPPGADAGPEAAADVLAVSGNAP